MSEDDEEDGAYVGDDERLPPESGRVVDRRREHQHGDTPPGAISAADMDVDRTPAARGSSAGDGAEGTRAPGERRSGQ